VTVDADDDRALIDEQIAELGNRVDVLREVIIGLVEAGADTRQQSQLLFNMVWTIRYLRAVKTEIPASWKAGNVVPPVRSNAASQYIS
jgi:hypothetical protein